MQSVLDSRNREVEHLRKRIENYHQMYLQEREHNQHNLHQEHQLSQKRASVQPYHYDYERDLAKQRLDTSVQRAKTAKKQRFHSTDKFNSFQSHPSPENLDTENERPFFSTFQKKNVQELPSYEDPEDQEE